MSTQPMYYPLGARAIKPDASAPTSWPRAIVATVGLVLMVISIVGMFTAPEEFDSSYILLGVWVVLTAIGAHVLHEVVWNRHRNWLGFDTGFMLGFIGALLVVPVYYLIGLITSGSDVWYRAGAVPKGMMLIAASLCAFVVGTNVQKERWMASRSEGPVNIQAMRTWKKVGLFLVYSGYVAAIITVLMLGPAKLGGSYRGMHDWDIGEKRLLLLTRTLLATGYAVATVAAGQLTGRWAIGVIPKVLLAVFCTFMLVFGDRSLVAQLLIPTAVAYSEYARRIKLKWLLVALVLGVLVMGVVQTARGVRQRSLDALWRVAREVILEEDWVESGLLLRGAASGSIENNFVAVSMFPEYYPYQWGKSHVAGVVMVVPFGSKLLPASWRSATSAHMFTFIRNKGDMDVGRGTCLTGDLYVNYGIAGTLVWMFLLGLIGTAVQQKARAAKTMGWGIAHVFLVLSFVMMARYPLSTVVRDVFWPLAAVLVFSKVLRVSRSLLLPGAPRDLAPRAPLPASPGASSGPVASYSQERFDRS